MIIFEKAFFMNLKDQIIWITGASSGIGAAMAVEYSKLGARLILSSRNTDELNHVRSSCEVPEKIKVLKLDLANPSDFKRIVKEAANFYGHIDILINNAGISQRSLAADTSLEVDRKIFDVNYFGTIALTKELIPYFKEKGQGHFVVITSVVGKIGTPLRSSYSASKHALHGFFDSLRAELYEDHIKVSLICPGFVNTNVSINALTGQGKQQGTKDKATANGLDPDYFAKKAIKAIYREKQEVVIGGFLEVLAVYVKRFFPVLLSRMVRKVKVT
jgi:short-subunit dehydrogenase